jgi:hypothetical protein
VFFNGWCQELEADVSCSVTALVRGKLYITAMDGFLKICLPCSQPAVETKLLVAREA